MAELLEQQAGTSSSAGNAPPRSCVLLHICDAPSHGREFNDYSSKHKDSYPEGPLRPLEPALPPPGRTKPWMEEARSVLHKLKHQLNVAKWVVTECIPAAQCTDGCPGVPCCTPL